MAILIEHFAGAFPTWLAPEQVRVIPITDDQAAIAEAVTKADAQGEKSAHADARSETLKYKIAEGVRMKVPYLAVIGKREAESDMIAINVRGAGKEQKPAPVGVDAFHRAGVGGGAVSLADAQCREFRLVDSALGATGLVIAVARRFRFERLIY